MHNGWPRLGSLPGNRPMASVGSQAGFGIGVALIQTAGASGNRRIKLLKAEINNEELLLPFLFVHFVFYGRVGTGDWELRQCSTTNVCNARPSTACLTDRTGTRAGLEGKVCNYLRSRRKAAVGMHARASFCADCRCGPYSQKPACQGEESSYIPERLIPALFFPNRSLGTVAGALQHTKIQAEWAHCIAVLMGHDPRNLVQMS